jgi:hypothetical protein
MAKENLFEMNGWKCTIKGAIRAFRPGPGREGNRPVPGHNPGWPALVIH